MTYMQYLVKKTTPNFGFWACFITIILLISIFPINMITSPSSLLTAFTLLLLFFSLLIKAFLSPFRSKPFFSDDETLHQGLLLTQRTPRIFLLLFVLSASLISMIIIIVTYGITPTTIASFMLSLLLVCICFPLSLISYQFIWYALGILSLFSNSFILNLLKIEQTMWLTVTIILGSILFISLYARHLKRLWHSI